jgi:8-amino-7-oxononanoate synthase
MKREGNSKVDLDNAGERFPALAFEQEKIHPALERRRRIGSLRTLTPFHTVDAIDFSSNDYLGLAQCSEQHEKVDKNYQSLPRHLLGSTGSRLLTGDSQYAQCLEQRLARWHNRPAALLCNSGYDANLAVLSSLTLHCSVIMDELCHNSLLMGVRLSKGCDVKTFLHNNLRDLERLLAEKRSSSSTKPTLIVVESVYSMDGDLAPLPEILGTALKYGACVIVDEAHGLGVFGENGMGVLAAYSLERHPALLCSIHTFGKAAGCHGAVVCGSSAIKEYLINYGRPIVYSTSLPPHSLVTITCAYESMAGEVGKQLRAQLCQKVRLFRQEMKIIMATTNPSISLVPSISPIQALIVPGNTTCKDFCNIVWNASGNRIRLYPIRSPTVPQGQERVRIIVHAHNTIEQIYELINFIETTLEEMGYRKREHAVTIDLISRL